MKKQTGDKYKRLGGSILLLVLFSLFIKKPPDYISWQSALITGISLIGAILILIAGLKSEGA